MAKKQTKMATKGAEELRSSVRGETERATDEIRARREEEEGRAGRAFGGAIKGYEQAQETGGYDPGALEDVRSRVRKVSETGGFDADRLSDIRSRMGAMQQSGGYDSDELKNLRDTGKGFTGTSGAFDPETLGRVMGGYGGFAETGGYTPEARAAFMRDATSGVGDIYKVMQAEANRRRSLTGGLGGGGEIAQMARQLSQQQSRAATSAQTELEGLVNRNKLAGLGGMAGVGESVAGQRLSALRGLGELESDVAGGRRGTMAQEVGLESDVAGGVRSGTAQMAGLEGDVARGRLAGTAGLGGLYDSASGRVSESGRQILSALGLRFNTEAEAVNALAQLSKNPGLFDNILRGVGTATGAITGVMGIPGMGGGRNVDHMM